jgi:hypothetical protein
LAAIWATPAATRAATCRSCWPAAAWPHGRHLAFNPAQPPPLSNLYVTMLQQLGLEVDRFGSSTGTLTGLSE